jgi:hypothetical protein
MAKPTGSGIAGDSRGKGELRAAACRPSCIKIELTLASLMTALSSSFSKPLETHVYVDEGTEGMCPLEERPPRNPKVS